MSALVSILRFLFSRRRAAVAIAATLIAFSAPAGAETIDDEDDEDDEDETITVRTTERDERWREDERFVSGMTTRIPTQDLAMRGETLADALSRVTGTYVRRQSSYGQSAHLSIRGGNPRQIVVDLDGLRLNAPAGTGFDVGKMMPQGLESADILRGPAATSRGGGAPAGAMQLNLASAGDEGVEVRGRLMGGSFGTASTEAELGLGNGVGGLLLFGGVRHSDGDFSFVDHRGQTRRRVNNAHQRAGLGATGHLHSGSHTFRLTGRFESGHAGSPGPSEFQESFRQAGVDDRRALATLRWEGVDTYATVGAQQYRQDYANERGFLTGEPFWSQSTESTAALTGGIRIFLGDSHLFRLDAEGRAALFEQQVHTPQRAEELRARRFSTALSASDEWLLADERISLIGSVRSEFSSDDQGADEFRPLLPAAGIIGRLHRRLELRANTARTYRCPHFDELYLETETIRGDRDLNSEEALVADAGLQLGAADDALYLQAGVFHHSIDSMILFLPASAHHYEARNLQGATSRGAETSVHVALNDSVDIDAAYTYTRARLDRPDGNSAPQLPGQPRHRLHLKTNFDVHDYSPRSRTPGLALRGAAHFRSPINLDNFGHLRNDAALRLDAGADLLLSSELRMGLQLQNLLDHRRAVDALQHPLAGRAIFLSLEMRGTR